MPLLKKPISGNISLKNIGVFALGLIVILFPLIVKDPYLMHLLIMGFINSILAMGFVMLISTGLLTLGAAAFFAVGAYASTLMVTKVGLSFWCSSPLAGIIAGVIALGIGAIIVRLSKVAFVFVTIMVAVIIHQTLGRVELFGGWGGIVSIPAPNPIHLPFDINVEFITKASYYYLILFLLLLTITVFQALYHSRIGRAWRAIKLNPRLAESLGISSYRYSLLAFVIVAIFAALAGSFYAHYAHTIEPDVFGFWTSIYIQVYGILGGIGFYISGPICGSIVMTFLPEILRITKEIEPIITGCILLVIIIFWPEGLLSLLRRIYASIRKMGKASTCS